MEAVAGRLKVVLSSEKDKYFPTQWVFSTAAAEQHCGLN